MHSTGKQSLSSSTVCKDKGTCTWEEKRMIDGWIKNREKESGLHAFLPAEGSPRSVSLSLLLLFLSSRVEVSFAP